MQGYDEKNELLLPPVHPGRRLNTEVLEIHERRCSQLKEESRWNAPATKTAPLASTVASKNHKLPGSAF